MKFLKIVAYKLSDGLWAFDHPHNDTVQELLMNGTEEAIDEHFYFESGRHAIENDQIEIILNTEELYVKVRPINKGLESFVKNTGMRWFLYK